MNGDQTAGLIAGLMCLILVGSSLLARRVPLAQSLKMALAWVAIFGGVYVLFLFRGEAATVWSRAKVDLFGQQPAISGGTMQIAAREDGHYYVTGRINGHEAEFLIDSGATTTALTKATADAAGLIDDGMPPVPVSTANGLAWARTARIAELDIGDIKQRDARTTIQDNMGTNLLGMSFLSELKSWRVERGTLVLQP